jgi:hypothetical protein
VRRAVRALTEGAPWYEAGVASASNGAAMRASRSASRTFLTSTPCAVTPRSRQSSPMPTPWPWSPPTPVVRFWRFPEWRTCEPGLVAIDALKNAMVSRAASTVHAVYASDVAATAGTIVQPDAHSPPTYVSEPQEL